MVTDEEIQAWAKEVAAALPPFTADEAREVGLLAARIDARRAQLICKAPDSTRRAAA